MKVSEATMTDVEIDKVSKAYKDKLSSFILLKPNQKYLADLVKVNFPFD